MIPIEIPSQEPHSQSPRKLSAQAYESELYRLQSELVTMQEWIRREGKRLVVICEGRDAAGKGSAIARITQYLNPRYCQVAALPKPTQREQSQWYFQRYVEHLPSAGEITIFDRSWYNRAGVELVMGFVTQPQYKLFLRQVPVFENLLIEDGIMLRKYWFSVSDVEQEKRFHSRMADPLRRWKLSPMDLAAITRWEDYSRAKDDMFLATDTVASPWYTVESEDKKRSRINVIAHLLSSVPYEHLEPEPLDIPPRPPRQNYYRPPRDVENHYVPDVAAALERGGKRSKKGKARSVDAEDLAGPVDPVGSVGPVV
ncbi:MAG: polyphosphate kinase 2 [Bifidobacteriaceae bacterium]|jgi:polyphosphate kinase 2|nr:polyphosphate kinase 2 [Bifidobacteriaceae bacterium]